MVAGPGSGKERRAYLLANPALAPSRCLRRKAPDRGLLRQVGDVEKADCGGGAVRPPILL
jgi:hypothetical protein